MRDLVPLHPAEDVLVDVILDRGFLWSGSGWSRERRCQTARFAGFIGLRAEDALMRLFKIVGSGRRWALLRRKG